VTSRLDGLWRHSDFVRLWVGQTISLLGSQIGSTAMAFTAILTLNATPAQLGLLETARALPVLLLGLLAGVWVDRLRRRPIMIVADLGRAVMLTTIPVAAILGVLRIEQLYIVAALVGGLAVLFDVAYPSYLPSLVQPERLVEGNSKLSMSDSLAEIIGPAIGGALVQAITAPMAILFDALSFVVSAISLGLIRRPEPPPASKEQHDADDRAVVRSVWQGIVAGLHVSIGDPRLRALLGSEVMISLAGGVIGTLYAVYFVQELGLTPLMIGVLIGVGGVSALCGAFFAERVVRRFGLGRTLIGSRLIGAATACLIVLAHGPLGVTLLLLALSQASDATWTIYAINALSFKQSITPNRMLGRVNASFNFLVGVAFPIGALMAGALGGLIGLRATLAIGIVLGATSALWLIFSPVRGMRVLPAHRPAL
jgi:MFS family permease